MMVIMALVTTFMTGPALNLINMIFRKDAVSSELKANAKYKILFSFGNAERGKSMLRLAHCLVKKDLDGNLITGLHLAASNEVLTFNVEDHERKMFRSVIAESDALNQKMLTLFKISYDIDSDIVEIANQGEYDLLLVGLGQSIFEGTLLGKVLGYTTQIINPDRIIDKFTGREAMFGNSPFDERTRQLLAKTKMPVGILIDKNLNTPDDIFIPIFTSDDSYLLRFVDMLVQNHGSRVIIYFAGDNLEPDTDVLRKIGKLETASPGHFSILPERVIKKEFLQRQDLMMISTEGYKYLLDAKSSWLANVPSVLIIKQ